MQESEGSSTQPQLAEDALATQRLGGDCDHEPEHGQTTVERFSEGNEAGALIGHLEGGASHGGQAFVTDINAYCGVWAPAWPPATALVNWRKRFEEMESPGSDRNEETAYPPTGPGRSPDEASPRSACCCLLHDRRPHRGHTSFSAVLQPLSQPPQPQLHAQPIEHPLQRLSAPAFP